MDVISSLNSVLTSPHTPLPRGAGGGVENPEKTAPHSFRTLFLLSGFILLLCGLTTGAGAYIVIPSEYFPTIQDGANGAGANDTLILEDGTYTNRTLFFRPITVASRFLLDGDTSHITATILDGGDSLDMLRFHWPETYRISGFSLTRTVTLWISPDSVFSGITLKNGATLSIDHCDFHDNTAPVILTPDHNDSGYHDCYGSLFMDQVRIYDNRCLPSGAFTYIMHEFVHFSLTNSELYRNEGQLININCLEDFYLAHCDFHNNVSVGFHGSMFMQAIGYYGIIENCRFVDNQLEDPRFGISITTPLELDCGVLLRNIEIGRNEFATLPNGFTSPVFLYIYGGSYVDVSNLDMMDNSITGVGDESGSYRFGLAIGSKSVTMNHIRIEGNLFDVPGALSAGYVGIIAAAIHTDATSSFSNITIRNNTIRRPNWEQNSEDDESVPGLTVAAQNLDLLNIDIRDNATDASRSGLGLKLPHLNPGDGADNHIRMKNVTIANNYNVHPNHDWLDRSHIGLEVEGTSGDTLRYATFEIEDCTFGDLAGDRNSGIGISTVDTLFIRNSQFHHIGNGCMTFGSTRYAELTNVLVHHIEGWDIGGIWPEDGNVIRLGGVDQLQLNQCTFADLNSTHLISQGSNPGRVSIHNSIVQGDFTSLIDPADGCTLTVAYSDIEGGYPGTGNIDANPWFLDPENGNYLLHPESPCVDAGDPDAAYNDPEDAHNPGQARAPAQGSVRADMGAFGGPGAYGLYHYLEEVPGTVTAPVVPVAVILYPNVPNPFNPHTFIEFELAYPQPVQLCVYNLLGEQISVLAEGHLPAGRYQRHFDGSQLASGVYIYRLEASGQAVSRKMLLVK